MPIDRPWDYRPCGQKKFSGKMYDLATIVRRPKFIAGNCKTTTAMLLVMF